MRTPPLLADFSHARACKPFCENSLTLPAIATMAKGLSISRSTIKRALAELIHQGRVEKQARFRENRGCTSNCYQIKQLMRI